MAAIHMNRHPGHAGHPVSRGMVLALATAAAARMGYLVARVVSDVHRIEADRRIWGDD